MNTALIIAGGVGSRAGQEIPKQFLTVNEIPIIIYTLKTFQEHKNIDRIVVVCLTGWHEVLKAYCRQFGISKLEAIVESGASRFDSVYNGVSFLSTFAQDSDIITMHDANRPLISAELIDRGQETALLHGNALAVIPCNDAMYISKSGKEADEYADKKVLFQGQTETFRYSVLKEICDRAREQGLGDFSNCALMLKFGVKVHLCAGDPRNFKITTPEDIDMFKALLAVPRTRKVK